MTECSEAIASTFDDLRQLAVKFSGLDLSSDAGVLLARQAEAQIGICRQMAGVITDPRA